MLRIYSCHLLPGIASGLASVFVAGMAEEAGYGFRLYGLYEARSPERESPLWVSKGAQTGLLSDFPAGHGRSALAQAFYQFCALTQTVVLAAISGGLAGLLTAWA
jgi:hypothetical protein